MEYSSELEVSSPFMEQWTLDARGVLFYIYGVDEDGVAKRIKANVALVNKIQIKLTEIFDETQPKYSMKNISISMKLMKMGLPKGSKLMSHF